VNGRAHGTCKSLSQGRYCTPVCVRAFVHVCVREMKCKMCGGGMHACA